MNQFYQSAFPQALGWSLIDSLWQMGLLWILYTVLTLNGRKATASLRFTLAFFFTGLGTSLFLFNLIFNLLYQTQHGVFYSLAVSLSDTVAEKFVGLDNPSFIPAISSTYLLLLAVYIVRLFAFSKRPVIIQQHSEDNAHPELQAILQCVSDHLVVGKKLCLKISDQIISPFTTGFLKPVIYLPLGIVGLLSVKELETIMAHELFHVKRNDYVANILLIFTEAILFFNPFARLLINICKKERENACDDLVLAAEYDRGVYGNALLILGRFSIEQPAMPLAAMAATGTSDKLLLQRINRIFRLRSAQKGWLKPLLLFFLCLFLSIFLLKGPAKTTSTLAAAARINPANSTFPPVVFAVMQTTVTAEIAQPVNKKSVVRPTKKIKTPCTATPPKPATPPLAARKTPDPPPALTIATVIQTRVNMVMPAKVYLISKLPALDYSIHPSTSEAPPEEPALLSVPYVPSASFYYPEFKAPKHTKTRRIIHL